MFVIPKLVQNYYNVQLCLPGSSYLAHHRFKCWMLVSFSYKTNAYNSLGVLIFTIYRSSKIGFKGKGNCSSFQQSYGTISMEISSPSLSSFLPLFYCSSPSSCSPSSAYNKARDWFFYFRINSSCSLSRTTSPDSSFPTQNTDFLSRIPDCCGLDCSSSFTLYTLSCGARYVFFFKSILKSSFPCIKF